MQILFLCFFPSRGLKDSFTDIHLANLLMFRVGDDVMVFILLKKQPLRFSKSSEILQTLIIKSPITSTTNPIFPRINLIHYKNI